MPTIYIDILTKPLYDSDGEEDGYDTESYEYEYDYEILKEEIITAFAEEYGLDFTTATKIIDDLDLYDALEERYEDLLEEILKERLYDDAYEEWQNNKEDY